MTKLGIRFTSILLLGGMIAAGLIPSACKHAPAELSASVPVAVYQPDSLVPATDPYGVALDLYHVEEALVRRNQTLSDLLHPMGLSMQEIHSISLLPFIFNSLLQVPVGLHVLVHQRGYFGGTLYILHV